MKLLTFQHHHERVVVRTESIFTDPKVHEIVEHREKEIDKKPLANGFSISELWEQAKQRPFYDDQPNYEDDNTNKIIPSLDDFYDSFNTGTNEVGRRKSLAVKKDSQPSLGFFLDRSQDTTTAETPSRRPFELKARALKQPLVPRLMNIFQDRQSTPPFKPFFGFNSFDTDSDRVTQRPEVRDRTSIDIPLQAEVERDKANPFPLKLNRRIAMVPTEQSSTTTTTTSTTSTSFSTTTGTLKGIKVNSCSATDL